MNETEVKQQLRSIHKSITELEGAPIPFGLHEGLTRVLNELNEYFERHNND